MYEVAYQIFNAKGQIVTKRKSFMTDSGRAKFIEKIAYDNNFYCIDSTRDPE